MVDEMLLNDVNEASENYLIQLKKKMEKFASIESFDYPLIPKTSKAVGGKDVSSKAAVPDSSGFHSANISGFARNSYGLVLTFMNDFFLLLNGQLHQYFVNSVISLIAYCGDILWKILESRVQFTDRQHFNIINDLRFFAVSFTPEMQTQISKKLGKGFNEFEALIKSLEGNNH